MSQTQPPTRKVAVFAASLSFRLERAPASISDHWSPPSSALSSWFLCCCAAGWVGRPPHADLEGLDDYERWLTLRERPGPQRRQLRAPLAAVATAAHGGGLSRPNGDRPRRPSAKLGRDLHTLPPPGLGPHQARHRPRRYSLHHGAQYPRVRRGLLWRAALRRRAQLAQHPARRRRHRLHPQARGSQGAADRPRVLRGHQGGAGAARNQAAGHRHRRSSGRGRRIDRRNDLRGLPGRRRPRLPLSTAQGRVAGHRPQLHLRHDRQPERRRLLAPGRLPERGEQQHDLGHAPLPDLSLDPADVPLQRLVLPLDDHRPGRHPRLPAPGRSGRHLRGHRRPRRHPPLRRAHRHGADAQCAGGDPPLRPITASP